MSVNKKTQTLYPTGVFQLPQGQSFTKIFQLRPCDKVCENHVFMPEILQYYTPTR